MFQAFSYLKQTTIVNSTIVAKELKNESGLERVTRPDPDFPRFSLQRDYRAICYFAPFYQLNAWNRLRVY